MFRYQSRPTNRHQQVGGLMARLAGVYREPARVQNDATSLLNSTAGQHLNPDIDCLLNNDGTSMRSLKLYGTIQMIYRGNTYHIPIDIYFPPNYAIRPPIIIVRPVSTMMIKQGHKHVTADGMVYMPYLSSWGPRTHNLIDAVVQMSEIFGNDPPVYARPPGSTTTANTHNVNVQHASVVTPSQPPPPQYDSVTREQERLRQIEREAHEANEAVRVAREAERLELQEQRRQEEMKNILNNKCVNIFENYKKSSMKELECFQEDKILLQKSADFVSGTKVAGAGISNGGGQIAYLRKRKEELEQHHSDLDAAIDQMESFINEAEKSKKSSSKIDVDELAVPADIHSAQMLVLSAENAAIHDALYFLDKGLSENKISMDVHLKAVRRLAKRQFLIKAHLLKIGQVKAEEVAKGTSWK